jgi:LacI family transcriptional regulator
MKRFITLFTKEELTLHRSQLTMKDLARAAGVSLGTASNVMANKPSVTPEIRERVLRAAQEIGYSPNAIAAGLRRQSTRTIGLCIPNLANPFFSDLAQEFNAVVEAAGYDVLIVETRENALHERARLRSLYARQVDGIFIVPTAEWSGETDPSIPVVVLDRIRRVETFPSVAMDNTAAVKLAFDALRRLGHRKIWMVVNAGEFWNSSLRVESFTNLSRGYGLVDQVHVVETGMDPQEIAQKLGVALAKDRPSAILCANGLATLGTLRALQDANLSSPENLSLLAIDDAVWMNVLRPAISVVRQPVAEMAVAAWEIMADLLIGKSGDARHVELAPTLIMRESTGVWPPTSIANGQQHE